jgi:hypothetical protein
LSLQQPQNEQKTPAQKRFRNQGKQTLSSIIGSYKSAITRHANRLGYNFVWQTRFYDNIICDDEKYCFITNYIENNPQTWESDKFFKNEI